MAVHRQEVTRQAKKLQSSFEKGHWAEAAAVLESVSGLAQELRKVDVCLLAQSLKTDLDNIRRHAEVTGNTGLFERFHDLVQRLNHLSWALGK